MIVYSKIYPNTFCYWKIIKERKELRELNQFNPENCKAILIVPKTMS